MDIEFERYKLYNLAKVNIIVGKNGCGKSTLLRAVSQNLRARGYVGYVTPERGGELRRDGNVESNIDQPDWVHETRNRNRFEQFRQMSISNFRKLETLVLRSIEAEAAVRASTFTFDDTLSSMNELLDRVKLSRSADGGFDVRDKASNEPVQTVNLSSGETELISLSIEIMAAAYGSKNESYKETSNWLLLDEPDVHLHPDLQFRLMKLLVSAIAGKPLNVIIATHSTSILGALSELTDVRLTLMKANDTELSFENVSEEISLILPIFGAHPAFKRFQPTSDPSGRRRR